jgi:hypothetical protein
MAHPISEAELDARRTLASAADTVQRMLSRYPADIERADEQIRSVARRRLDAATVGTSAMTTAAMALQSIAGVSRESIEIAAATGVAVDVILATLANLTAQLDWLDAAA